MPSNLCYERSVGFSVAIVIALMSAACGQEASTTTIRKSSSATELAERPALAPDYCDTGWYLDGTLEQDNAYEIRKKCHVGNIISNNGMDKAAKLCDMSKQVVAITGGYFVCYLAPPASTSDAKTSLNADAIEFAKTFFRDKMVTCGTRALVLRAFYGMTPFLAHVQDISLVEVRNVRFELLVPSASLSEVDRLNGVEYNTAVVYLSGDAYRRWASGKWSRWYESDYFLPRVMVWKVNGQWHAELAAGRSGENGELEHFAAGLDYQDLWKKWNAATSKLSCTTIPNS
jgi:hypothetical protein